MPSSVLTADDASYQAKTLVRRTVICCLLMRSHQQHISVNIPSTFQHSIFYVCGQARLEDEIAVGGNTIRVWGGGIYETETFYRTADRLGLIILQDGSFFGSCKLQIMPRLCRHDCHASDVMHRPRQIRRSINTRTRRLRPTWRTWPSRTWLRGRSRTR